MGAVFGSPPTLEKDMKMSAIKNELNTRNIPFTTKMKKAELEELLAKGTLEVVEAEEVKPKPHPGDGDARADISIICMVETVDGEVHEKEFTIHHPRGCLRSDQINNPAIIFGIMQSGLVAKLGAGHIKT
jgi:hypothetical protein